MATSQEVSRVTPVWMIEGGASAVDGFEPDGSRGDEREGRTREERRFSALAAAIRAHESTGRHQAMPARPQDLALYRRLRQICGQT
jgi:hypothetical protein